MKFGLREDEVLMDKSARGVRSLAQTMFLEKE
jgi:hypothetical protein